MMTSPFIDAHCHIDPEKKLLDLLIQHRIPATINCQNTLEWKTYYPLTSLYPFLTLSFGIHPWEADKYRVEDYLEIFKQTTIIGETGLDNVWTSVNMTKQKQVFREQLSLATQLNKPVILHTKGMEKEISDIITDFPNRYLVHWYSSLDHLDAYIKQDCYFTIGPSLLTDTAVKQVLTTVPKNRLLVESDGLAALAWAIDQDVVTVDYLVLQSNLVKECASMLEMSLEEFKYLINQNYRDFLQADE